MLGHQWIESVPGPQESSDLYESPINRVQLSGASGLLIVSYEIQAQVVVSPAPELTRQNSQHLNFVLVLPFMVASAGAAGAGSAQLKEGPLLARFGCEGRRRSD